MIAPALVLINWGVFHFRRHNRPEGFERQLNRLNSSSGTFFLSTHLKHTLINSHLAQIRIHVYKSVRSELGTRQIASK